MLVFFIQIDRKSHGHGSIIIVKVVLFLFFLLIRLLLLSIVYFLLMTIDPLVNNTPGTMTITYAQARIKYFALYHSVLRDDLAFFSLLNKTENKK